MKVNKTFLPIKAHYFFFMAALGPILPQLNVFGKELGISPVFMGYITGILPILFLVAKPAFGLLVDVYRDYRKFTFMLLIVNMVLLYGLLNFIPQPLQTQLQFKTTLVYDSAEDYYKLCSNRSFTLYKCVSDCLPETKLLKTTQYSSKNNSIFCELEKNIVPFNSSCTFDCNFEGNDLYNSFSFWGFVLFMSIGTISFNVANSISDAICFDVIGDNGDYGQQRVWGTVGFGVTALISGYIVNLFSDATIHYGPAFLVMLVCSVLDLLVCTKLQLPIIKPPENIFNQLKELLSNRRSITFIVFAVCAGIVDGLIIYFLFWYLEDLASTTNTPNVKLIEGCIVAAETLGAEVIFFSVSGKILKTIGHVHCFSMCFINYALRLGLISIAPSPWWLLPVEFFFQGPTYALTYSTIVEYANKIAPEGASATMQGIAAGMDDGLGYAIGSLLGGLLFNYVGGKNTFQIFSVFALLCGTTHALLHKTILSEKPSENINCVEYKSPEEAFEATNS